MKRVCQKCGEEKPIEEFSKDSRIKSGYLWKCKMCEEEDIAAWLRATRASYESR